MKHRLYAITVLFVGLLSAQIIGTIHVHITNMDLMQATKAIMLKGYLTVPNAVTAWDLETWRMAMAGGVFFTLSVGAGLSLTTLAAVWLWDRIFRRRRCMAIGCLLVWLSLFYSINANGFNPAASTYLVVVPLITGASAILFLPEQTPLVPPVAILWPVSAVVILALSWVLVLDGNLFINIRDHLLLPTPAGRRIVDMYYKYTLFPANAFQSLTQKQIRTCVLDATIAPSRIASVERTVRSHDWLPVTPDFPADLVIVGDTAGETLTLVHKHRRMLTVSTDTFLTQPEKTFSAYADRLDRNRMFRLLALVGLTIGFPLLIFSMAFCLFSTLFHFGWNASASKGIAALLCVFLGIPMVIPIYRARAAMETVSDPAVALAAPSRYTRMAALRQACQQHLDIAMAARKAGLSTSLDVAERYWLAKSLAHAHHPQAATMLQALARDPSPIVVCQALWAMGQRRNRTAIPHILRRINTDSRWYVQMYAYRALRSLGWVQPQSPHAF